MNSRITINRTTGNIINRINKISEFKYILIINIVITIIIGLPNNGLPNSGLLSNGLLSRARASRTFPNPNYTNILIIYILLIKVVIIDIFYPNIYIIIFYINFILLENINAIFRVPII